MEFFHCKLDMFTDIYLILYLLGIRQHKNLQ